MSTASESSLDDYLEDCAIQSVIIKPILANPGVLSKIESTIRHVHVSIVTDNASPTLLIPVITKPTGDETYNITSLCIPDEFLCT